MDYQYCTLKQPSEGTYREKGSKFLAFAYPVKNNIEIDERLAEVKSDHARAHHKCYAYILGHNPRESRVFDDGEPKHSAGEPILGQMRSLDLTNTLIIVVRYFGGRKLGIGGLINAYRQAAREALMQANIIKKYITETWTISCSYQELGAVLKVARNLNLKVLSREMTDTCTIKIEVKLKQELRVKKQLKMIPDISLEVSQ